MTGPISPETLRTADALRRAITLIARRLRRLRADHGISAAKLSLLGQLYRTGRAVTAVDLARLENLQPQSLTRIIAELDDHGLLSRRPDDVDRRQIMITLTQAGRDLLIQDAKAQNAWLAQAIERELTGTEQALVQLSASLLERMAAEGRPGALPLDPAKDKSLEPLTQG